MLSVSTWHHTYERIARLGWRVYEHSPGDGMTRYAFFHNPTSCDQNYFGPENPKFTALGRREAYILASGIGLGAGI